VATEQEFEMRPSGRVTSADVAKRAGVSRATVSYVVNGLETVNLAPETRERVLAAAAELGYSQYGPGRTLKSGRSDVVLFVLNDLPGGHAVNTLLDELEAKLAASELSLVIFRVTPRGNPLSRIWREIGPFAVIGIESINDRDAAEMQVAGIDVIRLVLQGGDEPGVLTQSQTEVGEAQVRYLAGRGRSRLGYAYPDDPRVEAFASLRLKGAQRAARDLGLPELDIRTVPLDRAAATQAVRAWTETPEPVTGVCAYNDEVAYAVLAGIADNGKAVPQDIAVIGVDNDPLGALINPSLTTVDTRHVETADELARLVIAARNGATAAMVAISHEYEVIVRASAP
jgi:DNA-binding LacI/PurR family transcriptional regulator